MGGKKKTLAHRLAKMSEEERQRYLQHKADQEEELRRRKEQLINTFLKNKIKHEDAFARLNVAKLNENWHQILRKTKCAEMKKDVMFMKEYVERILEFKNRTIAKLLAEVQEAEEQYTNNLQSHLNYINKMIDFSKQAVDDMHEEYDDEVDARIKEATSERSTTLQAAFEQELHLKTLCFQFDEKSKSELRENYDHYFKIADAEMQKNAKEFKKMRNEKEKQITQLWLEMGKHIKDYIEKTGVKRAHLAELTALDAQNGEEIKHNENQLMRAQIQLHNLEHKFAKMQDDTDTEIQRLEEHVAELKADFLKQKTSTFKQLKEDETNIQLLSAASNESIQELQKQLDRGEKILQLSLICRKFETEEEVATRFATISTLDDEQSQLLAGVPSSPAIDDVTPIALDEDLGLAGEHFARVQQMDNFWRFYNKLLIKVMDMRKLKADLQQQNLKLKGQIKQEMEARVDQALDDKLLKNAKEIEKSLFVVRASATSVKTNCT